MPLLSSSTADPCFQPLPPSFQGLCSFLPNLNSMVPLLHNGTRLSSNLPLYSNEYPRDNGSEALPYSRVPLPSFEHLSVHFHNNSPFIIISQCIHCTRVICLHPLHHFSNIFFVCFNTETSPFSMFPDSKKE